MLLHRSNLFFLNTAYSLGCAEKLQEKQASKVLQVNIIQFISSLGATGALDRCDY